MLSIALLKQNRSHGDAGITWAKARDDKPPGSAIFLPAAVPLTRADRVVTAKKPSRAGRIYARLIAGQERRARAGVTMHLDTHSDHDLARFGWSPADIAWLRRSPAQ